MSSLSQAHHWCAWFVVVANAVVGAWSLTAHRYESWRGRALWVAIAIAELSLFVQVVLGIMRASQADMEAAQFHTFYGFLTLVAVMILYGYRNQVEQWRYLLYGFGSLFIMGLAIRAMTLPAWPS